MAVVNCRIVYVGNIAFHASDAELCTTAARSSSPLPRLPRGPRGQRPAGEPVGRSSPRRPRAAPPSPSARSFSHRRRLVGLEGSGRWGNPRAAPSLAPARRSFPRSSALLRRHPPRSSSPTAVASPVTGRRYPPPFLPRSAAQKGEKGEKDGGSHADSAATSDKTGVKITEGPKADGFVS
uniref:Uncharacterized protein n=1 Tax=Oryza nivara TaxID=4536 RepID=A0A0E0I7L8_ORYNI